MSVLKELSELKDLLPSPVFEREPLWIETYGKAWEIAFRNFHEPAPGSGFVSPFIDAAFNENIFLWDTCFMTMFCNVAHPLVPGISSLDNFYAKQHPDGEICREINRSTGEDFPPWRNSEDKPLFSRWGWGMPRAFKRTDVRYQGREIPRPNPRLTLDALNHPLLCWAELEHYRWTADAGRLKACWDHLVRYYRALQEYLRQGNGLYMTDWASMDNSPRNRFLTGGGTGVDISCEMALFARQLAEIARIIGQPDAGPGFLAEAEELAGLINALLWNEKQGFYFDLTLEGRQTTVKTVAAYWSLLAGVASPEQARSLIGHLRNPKTFGRLNPVPTCAADERGYKSNGGYWRGATWAPIITMVVRGLEKYGEEALAREIALKHVDLVARVYEKTGTIWENYAPDAPEPGTVFARHLVRKDFVGWSGIGPILYLLEYAVGLSASAADNRLDWRIASDGSCGCRNFRFAGHVASLIADAGQKQGERRLRVDSDSPFSLRVTHAGRTLSFDVHKGANVFLV